MIVAVDGYRTVPFVAAAGSCSADSDSVVGDENHYAAAAAVCAEDNSDLGTSICRQRQDYHNVRLDVVAVVVVVVVAAAAAGAALLLVAAFADVAVVAVVVAAFPVVVAAPAAVAV